MPTLVPRPDGRGALLTGGMPGNKGGPGRPPDELRGLSRAAFHGLVREIQRRIDVGLLEQAQLSELAQLLGVTGRIGLEVQAAQIPPSAIPEIRERVERMIALILQRPTWETEALLQTLSEVWHD